MENNKFAVKGTFLYSESLEKLSVKEDSYLICENGLIAGFTEIYPENMPLYDFSGKIIIPGMYDLHTHASQFAYRGLSMDMELLKWLTKNAFPEENKFKDLSYAERAYGLFTEELLKSPTAGACIFAEIHTNSTLLLMKKLESAGLSSFVGKVNMDRNCPDYICETAEDSIKNTLDWIEKSRAFANVKPIITPRFIPSCTNELMEGLSQIRKEYNLPVQSHLSENLEEIDLVAKLCPDSASYADAYLQSGLIGKTHRSVMAHCVYSDSPEEMRLLRENNVFIAHCPQSNENIASGIAPIRKYLEKGLKVGLGTDVAGGAHLSMFRAMTDAIQMSKLYWRLVDNNLKPLTFPEAFFMATRGGGEFFGKCGSFGEGFSADFTVLDDANLKSTMDFSPEERLQRIVYLSDDRSIFAKFVGGRKVL